MDANEREVISIIVNGEVVQVPSGLSVATLLTHLNLDPSRLAIELNREIIRKPAWATTPIEPGARLEIVQFVGGG
jgi:thiamine biosynthesis protein ThiS